MSDQVPSRNQDAARPTPFEELLGNAANAGSPPSSVPQQSPQPVPGGGAFTTAFRGYDKTEVDEALSELRVRLRSESERVSFFEDRYRRANDAAGAKDLEAAERAADERAAAVEAAKAESRETIERLQAQVDALTAQQEASAGELEAELGAAKAKAAAAEQQVQALTEELRGAETDSADRSKFEEILRVAEEQAGVLIRNASVQGDRLLEASREEIENRRRDLQAEAAAIISQAEHEAQQIRLKIDTELTAHTAQLEREAAHGAEKVAQAEREAATIRTEAEKGAAALRAMVANETSQQRAEAEEAVRELRMRTLEFEESLTRRQDDAQQEFLVLHNQAVAHAERITQDANDQVAASLEHAQRVSAKADDFDKLMRAQAQQIEADAKVRAREVLDRAHIKAQKIIDTVTAHSQGVLRDAEDRTRNLRWQQHQLSSFMSEVKELIRPEARGEAAAETAGTAEQDAAPADGEIDELETLYAQSGDGEPSDEAEPEHAEGESVDERAEESAER